MCGEFVAPGTDAAGSNEDYGRLFADEHVVEARDVACSTVPILEVETGHSGVVWSCVAGGLDAVWLRSGGVDWWWDGSDVGLWCLV